MRAKEHILLIYHFQSVIFQDTYNNQWKRQCNISGNYIPLISRKTMYYFCVTLPIFYVS